jgi:DNA-binding helix-hairpin-helix protein with protein kinase domain
VLRYLIASTVSLLVMIVAGAVIARRRRVVEPSIAVAQPVTDGAPVSGAATTLARAARSGLAEIADLSHEPRQAIIACYAAMERELRHFPGAIPQDFDTPTEVLARAVEHHALHVDNAAELVNLFEEARFSPHVMTEEHRGRAIDVLELVLADMRSTV